MVNYLMKWKLKLMINDINELFSTREIATIIWLFIIIIFGIYKPKVRDSFLNLLKMFLNLFKHTITIIIFLYFLLMVYLFTLFDVFSFISFKDYFIWYFFVLFSLVGLISEKVFTIKLSQIFFGTIKLSIIPYFIINYYTYDLWKELIMLPTIIILSLGLLVAQTDDKYRPVDKLINIVLAIIGFLIMVYAIKSLSANISDIRQSDFWISMFLDVILIFIHIPFLFLLRFLLMYEGVVIKLKYILSKNKLNKFRMKNIRVFFIVFKKCMFNKKKIQYLNKHAFLVDRPSNYGELNNNIKVLIKEEFK